MTDINDQTECRGFHWIGQSWEHCDMCGQSWRWHEGLVTGGSPFSSEGEFIRPWTDFPSKGGRTVFPVGQRSRLIDVIVHHTMVVGPSGQGFHCACGWGRRAEDLGRSFAEHVVATFEESVRAAEA